MSTLTETPSTELSTTQLRGAAYALSREDLGVYGIIAHGHTPATVHERWIDAASAVLNGTSSKRKLLIVAPPGHAKSTWLSLILPPWYLGNHPDHSLLFFTSSDTMARQFGGTVKTTLESNDGHSAVFADRSARPDPGRGWSTDGLYLRGVPAGSKDPSYRALGYGAAVVGARAHGIILDDPLTQEQARSPVEQLKARQYHDLTVDSRLHPDGWELAIMTRWHDNDLAAHLGGKSEWDVLHLPALSEQGEALWPERFSADWMRAKQAEIGGPLFACVPGDTGIELTSELIRATRRQWQGGLTKITTARGYELSGTPNHPVLSGRGWVGLSELTEGDYVFSRRDRQVPSVGRHDIDSRHTTIGQCFEAAQVGGLFESVRTTRKDFHGDGQDGEVDVVSANGILGDRVKAAFPQPLGHFRFASANAMLARAESHDRTSTMSHVRFTPGLAGSTSVHVGDDPRPFVGAQSRPSTALAVAARESGDVKFFEPIEYGRSCDAVLRAEGYGALAGFVAADQIVRIDRDIASSTHVYNLETEDHTYLANGILTHNCVYQGDPRSLGGLVFKESAWFRPLPADLDRSQMTIVQFWDLAFSERQTADYSACCTLGAFQDGRLAILEMYRARLSPLDLEAAVRAKIDLWRPAAVGVEEGAFKQAVTADLVARLQARAAARVQAIKPAGDKVARAYLPAGRGEAGLLYADRAAPWFPPFEAEALGFPLSSHDDQVDALSGAAQMAVEHMALRDTARAMADMIRTGQTITVTPDRPAPRTQQEEMAEWLRNAP